MTLNVLNLMLIHPLDIILKANKVWKLHLQHI